MLAATRAVNTGRRAQERIAVCVGLGYGPVLRVGGDVWGAEVNAASKLGEDLAQGGEILVTAGLRAALPHEPFTPRGLLSGSRPVFRRDGQ